MRTIGRSMHRGLLLMLAIAAILHAASIVAFAAPEVSLESQSDGTFTVIGTGWRPGQQLIVSVDRATFEVVADSAGGFEVPTGLTAYQGPVTVRRRDTSPLAMARLGPRETPDVPHPLALVFAQSLATGAALLALAAGPLTLAGLVSRRLRRRSHRA